MTTEESYLFDRIGGEAALEAAVDVFYDKLTTDDMLKGYFVGFDMDRLKAHQRKFMKVAFTKIPDDFDVGAFLSEKHAKLFERGLSELHFDAVATHFVATLESLGVEQNLINEAVSVIAPLRPIFEKGAADAKARAKEAEEKKDEVA